VRGALVAAALVLSAAAADSSAPAYPFRDPQRPQAERLNDLLSRMTIAEKIDAVGFMPAVPRLGVTGTFTAEGYHGVAQGGPSNWGKYKPTPTTQFPQAYGLGATWDPELLQRVAAQEAYEARYLVQSEKYQRAGLVVMSPNTDLARDPRWGRTEEVYGEDPFLVGTLAAGFVRGLQGDDPKYLKTASLLKHFLANSNEDGREHSSSNFDERLWREYYGKSFEIAIRRGGARSLMAAYNAINGTPCHVHPMLREIVMKEWGLNGIITTDGGGLTNLVKEHKAFPGMAEASAACIKAGINLFLDQSKEGLTEAVQRGLLSEADLDEALGRKFGLFFDLGLFDPPELVPYAKIGREPGIEPWDDPATRALVREVTRKSIVLLKNDGALLPLDASKVNSVAVVGPLADTVLLDLYSGTPPYRVTPHEGVEAYAQPVFFMPSKFDSNWVGDMSDAAVEAARKRDIAIVCVGNHPLSNAGWEIVTSPSEGKEAVDRKEIVLPPAQEEFIRKVYAANPRTIVVLVTNFPFAMPWVVEHVPAILQLTHASQEQGNALADVLFGEFNPGGKTVQTWPKSLEQLPPMMDYDIRHGRTYMYAKDEPQFAFGFGLSYTTFHLSNLQASRTVTRDGTLTVSVDVANTGKRAGDEVVQLYVHYPESKVERPRKQLKAFRRLTVDAGQTKMAELSVPAADLAYWDVAAHRWVVETGPVELLVGTSSRDTDLTLRQTVRVE
jgi:beta-glucosidase